VAALIKQDLDLDTDLEPGGRGELSVWLDGVKIAEKTRTGFPSDTALLTKIKTALQG
jgi:predicted Rdx family selenoprotein